MRAGKAWGRTVVRGSGGRGGLIKEDKLPARFFQILFLPTFKAESIIQERHPVFHPVTRRVFLRLSPPNNHLLGCWKKQECVFKKKGGLA
jgi:hypothetical protein